MDNYRVTVGVEPTNDYDKAKQDLMEAYKSFSKLKTWQKEQLAKELYGADAVALLLKIMQQYRR